MKYKARLITTFLCVVAVFANAYAALTTDNFQNSLVSGLAAVIFIFATLKSHRLYKISSESNPPL